MHIIAIIEYILIISMISSISASINPRVLWTNRTSLQREPEHLNKEESNTLSKIEDIINSINIPSVEPISPISSSSDVLYIDDNEEENNEEDGPISIVSSTSESTPSANPLLNTYTKETNDNINPQKNITDTIEPMALKDIIRRTMNTSEEENTEAPTVFNMFDLYMLRIDPDILQLDTYQLSIFNTYIQMYLIQQDNVHLRATKHIIYNPWINLITNPRDYISFSDTRLKSMPSLIDVFIYMPACTYMTYYQLLIHYMNRVVSSADINNCTILTYSLLIPNPNHNHVLSPNTIPSVDNININRLLNTKNVLSISINIWNDIIFSMCNTRSSPNNIFTLHSKRLVLYCTALIDNVEAFKQILSEIDPNFLETLAPPHKTRKKIEYTIFKPSTYPTYGLFPNNIKAINDFLHCLLNLFRAEYLLAPNLTKISLYFPMSYLDYANSQNNYMVALPNLVDSALLMLQNTNSNRMFPNLLEIDLIFIKSSNETTNAFNIIDDHIEDLINSYSSSNYIINIDPFLIIRVVSNTFSNIPYSQVYPNPTMWHV
ncbi:hypothetical protein NEOKW01_0088 [Nematocida sp. AWRm80]|nr:hypothetical protein NEOKW01_0088 [Nematocida sp. AWRm80]